MKHILVVVLLLLGTAGCAAEEPSRPPVCDSWVAVQTTVDHIRNANVSENGLSALRPYLSQLRTELNTLYADAQTQFASQAQALRTSVDSLTADLRVAKDAPDPGHLRAVRASVGAVRASANSLHNAMKSTC